MMNRNVIDSVSFEDITGNTKRCPRCEEHKPLYDFYKDKEGKPKCWCKSCVIADNTERNRIRQYPRRKPKRLSELPLDEQRRVRANRRQYRKKLSNNPKYQRARLDGRKQLNEKTRESAARHCANWTDSELRFLQEHPEMTDLEIGQVIGRSKLAVFNKRQREHISGEHRQTKRIE